MNSFLKKTYTAIICLVILVTCSSCSNEFASYRPIEDIHNLDGRKVGVQLAWASDYILSERDGKDLTICRYDNVSSLVMALCFKQVDAIALDNTVWQEVDAIQPGLKACDEPIATDYYVSYINHNREDILKQFNEFIAEMQDNGELAKYQERWDSFDGVNYEWPDGLELTGTGPVLRLGYANDYYPTSFSTSDGVGQGYELELWVLFANKYNYTLELTGTTEEETYNGLQFDRYDVAIAASSEIYAHEAREIGLLVTDTYKPINIWLIEVSDETVLNQGEEIDF